MGIKRKALVRDKDDARPVGPKPIKLHRSVDPDDLEDAVGLNGAQDGFVFSAAAGDRLVVVRPADGGRGTSVCTVLRVAPGPDGLVETYDETRQQLFAFTANEVAVHYDTVTVKILGSARVERC